MGPRRLLALAAVAVLAVGCSDDATPEPTPTPAPTPTPTATATPTPSATPTREPETRLGIDASHHQGAIDWPRVADAGVTFAYLKASEGTGFVDPRFADHRRAATRAGIDVAGYHYFQLCTDGTAQARHFVEVTGLELTDAKVPAVPPALDLELAGSCTEPPPRAELLAEVREFLDLVDAATGVPTLVYLYPELEERFGFAADLADHPQWVRRLGERPPRREWAVWQYDDAGTVPGVGGGVDLNRMKESLGAPGR